MTFFPILRRALIATYVFMGLFLVAFASNVQAGTVFNFDYATDTNLPSAEGFIYISGYAGNIAESQVFQISSGLLHINTTQFNSDVYAYYQFNPGYDRNLDTVFETKIRVLSAGSVASMQFAFYDEVNSSIFTINQSNFLIYGLGVGGSLGNPSDFHVLTFQKPGGSNQYSFSVDGVVVSSGSLPGGYTGGPLLYFGDGTPTGGNVTADIAYIHYSNTNAVTVPESSAVVLAGIGAIAIIVVGVRKQRRATA